MAHSKQSNVWTSPPRRTVNARAYSLPQTSQTAMVHLPGGAPARSRPSGPERVGLSVRSKTRTTRRHPALPHRVAVTPLRFLQKPRHAASDLPAQAHMF